MANDRCRPTALIFSSSFLLYKDKSCDPEHIIGLMGAEIKEHARKKDRFTMVAVAHKNQVYEVR